MFLEATFFSSYPQLILACLVAVGWSGVPHLRRVARVLTDSSGLRLSEHRSERYHEHSLWAAYRRLPRTVSKQ